MAKAIRFHKTGGPEVMQLEEMEVGAPGAGPRSRGPAVSPRGNP